MQTWHELIQQNKKKYVRWTTLLVILHNIWLKCVTTCNCTIIGNFLDYSLWRPQGETMKMKIIKFTGPGTRIFPFCSNGGKSRFRALQFIAIALRSQIRSWNLQSEKPIEKFYLKFMFFKVKVILQYIQWTY